MDNSPCGRMLASENGVRPVYPIRGGFCTPLRPNGVHHVTRMGYTPCTPEENSYLDIRATWKRITQLNQVPKVRARALPSLWITR